MFGNVIFKSLKIYAKLFGHLSSQFWDVISIFWKSFLQRFETKVFFWKMYVQQFEKKKLHFWRSYVQQFEKVMLNVWSSYVQQFEKKPKLLEKFCSNV